MANYFLQNWQKRQKCPKGECCGKGMQNKSTHNFSEMATVTFGSVSWFKTFTNVVFTRHLTSVSLEIMFISRTFKYLGNILVLSYVIRQDLLLGKGILCFYIWLMKTNYRCQAGFIRLIKITKTVHIFILILLPLHVMAIKWLNLIPFHCNSFWITNIFIINQYNYYRTIMERKLFPFTLFILKIRFLCQEAYSQ